MPDTRRKLMNGEHWRQSSLSAVVTAAITAGTLIGYMQINPPREDPFRGVDGEALRLEIKADIKDEAQRTREILAGLRDELRRLDDAHRQVMQDNAIRLRQLESRTWPE